MDEGMETFPILSTNATGSSASKYAHAYNPKSLEKIRNLSQKEKQIEITKA